MHVGVEVKGRVLCACRLFTAPVQIRSCGMWGREQGRAGLCCSGGLVPVPVNEGIEGQAIPPAGGEILDVYLGVTDSGEGEQKERRKSQEGREGVRKDVE